MLHYPRGAFVVKGEKGIRCKSVAASTTVSRHIYSPHPQPILRHAASLEIFSEKARVMKSVSQETCHNNYF